MMPRDLSCGSRCAGRVVAMRRPACTFMLNRRSQS
jgi:hypothetical protein